MFFRISSSQIKEMDFSGEPCQLVNIESGDNERQVGKGRKGTTKMATCIPTLL
jgi:hypothetical protein